jgi:hypothetical protein
MFLSYRTSALKKKTKQLLGVIPESRGRAGLKPAPTRHRFPGYDGGESAICLANFSKPGDHGGSPLQILRETQLPSEIACIARTAGGRLRLPQQVGRSLVGAGLDV